MKSLIKKYNVLLRNFFSLSVLNIINFLSPLITLPYLIEVLGIESYGTYAFVYGILLYVNMFVNFGFQFSATKQVSINRDNNNKISELFSEVFIIRIIISISMVSFVYLGLSSIAKYNNIANLFLGGAGIAVGTAFMPNFLYQGMEKMKYIIISSAIPKLIMISSVFFVIKSKEDVGLLMHIQSTGFLLAGIISSLIAIKIFKIKLILRSFKDLYLRAYDTFYLFISTVGISLYRESAIVILGIVTNYEIVGYYSAAEKIIRAIQAILNPIAQSLFPHFAKEFDVTKTQKKPSASGFIQFVLYYSLLLTFVVISVLFILPLIITHFTDNKYIKSLIDIKILSPVIFFGSLNFVVGIVGLVNLGHQKYFTKVILLVGVIGIIASYFLATLYQDIGVAITVSAVELIIFLFLFRKLWTIK